MAGFCRQIDSFLFLLILFLVMWFLLNASLLSMVNLCWLKNESYEDLNFIKY